MQTIDQRTFFGGTQQPQQTYTCILSSLPRLDHPVDEDALDAYLDHGKLPTAEISVDAPGSAGDAPGAALTGPPVVNATTRGIIFSATTYMVYVLKATVSGFKRQNWAVSPGAVMVPLGHVSWTFQAVAQFNQKTGKWQLARNDPRFKEPHITANTASVGNAVNHYPSWYGPKPNDANFTTEYNCT